MLHTFLVVLLLLLGPPVISHNFLFLSQLELESVTEGGIVCVLLVGVSKTNPNLHAQCSQSYLILHAYFFQKQSNGLRSSTNVKVVYAWLACAVLTN